MAFEKGTRVNFCFAREFTRVDLRLLTGGEGNSQICKNLSLRRQQEIAQDKSQGLNRQFLGGVELNGTRDGDDLRKGQRSLLPFPQRFVRYLICIKRIQRVRVFLEGRGQSFDFRCCSANLIGHHASGERAGLSIPGRFRSTVSI